jgi:hypothetical protein
MPPVKVRSLVAPLLTALLLAAPSPSAFAHGPAPSQAPTTPPGRAVAEQLTLELAGYGETSVQEPDRRVPSAPPSPESSVTSRPVIR